MISLKRIFDDLAYGELTNLAIGQSQLGTISEANYPRVLSLVNRALTKLASRFVLRIREVNVHQIAGQTRYEITSQHADEASQCGANDIYVEEDPDVPFEDDIIKILTVYGEDGYAKNLNDTSKSNSLFTPEFNVLETPDPDPPEILTVEYQATLPEIKLTTGFNPENIFVNIPRALITPLNIYIVHLVLSGMNTRPAEGEQTPATTWLNRFEMACRDVVYEGIAPERTESQTRFKKNGFV